MPSVYDMAAYSKRRRDRNRAAKLCINGKKHGQATHGTLCARCRQRRRESESSVPSRPFIASQVNRTGSTFVVVLERTGETFEVAHTAGRPVWR